MPISCLYPSSAFINTRACQNTFTLRILNMAQKHAEPWTARLLSTGQYSDLTLMCHGHAFKVHKAVVCSQSPVLKVAVSGAFKVRRTYVAAPMVEADSTSYRRLQRGSSTPRTFGQRRSSRWFNSCLLETISAWHKVDECPTASNGD
jgi:hypothetical protein